MWQPQYKDENEIENKSLIILGYKTKSTRRRANIKYRQLIWFVVKLKDQSNINF